MVQDKCDSNIAAKYKTMVISKGDLNKVWPMATPFFERVLERNSDYTSLEIMREGLESDSSSTLMVIVRDDVVLEMAVICEVMECPTGQKVLMIPHLAGVNMAEWIPMLVKDFHNLARSAGCFRIMIAGGRPGWERAMKPYGGKLSHVVVEFDTEAYFKGKHHG